MCLLLYLDKFAALWPFLGIVAEVIIIVSIIFIYERRSTNAASKDANGVDDDIEGDDSEE